MEQAIALRLQVGPAASLSGVRAAELWSLQAGCSPGKTSWAHNEFSPKLLTKGSSLCAHFTDEKIQERAGNPALMRSAGTGHVLQHPSSSSITTWGSFNVPTPGTFLQGLGKPQKSQTQQKMSSNHRTATPKNPDFFWWIPNHSKGRNSWSTIGMQRGWRAPRSPSQRWRGSDPELRPKPCPRGDCQEGRCLGEGAQEREQSRHKPALSSAHHYRWL